MTTTHKASIGTIIQATLRTEDLLDAFAGELDRLSPGHRVAGEAYGILEMDNPDFDDDVAVEVILDLEDALNEFAPPFCFFGAIDGDGADFGFWPSMDAIAEAMFGLVSDDDGFTFLDDDNVWLHVNDHGNVTLYANDDGKPGTELWAIV
jgi:hypothetical protein